MMTCFSTFWWSLASSPMALRLPSSHEDFVGRCFSFQQPEAASLPLPVSGPPSGAAHLISVSRLSEASGLEDQPQPTCSWPSDRWRLPCLCQTHPHLGEPLGSVDGMAFREPAIHLDLKMQCPPQIHFLSWEKEGIFLAQHEFSAFQGSFWGRNLDHGCFFFLWLSLIVSIFCTLWHVVVTSCLSYSDTWECIFWGVKTQQVLSEAWVFALQ